MPSIGSFSRYADLMDKGRPPDEIWEERLAFFREGIPIVEGLTNVGYGERSSSGFRFRSPCSGA
jgi:hypothetical protein